MWVKAEECSYSRQMPGRIRQLSGKLANISEYMCHLSIVLRDITPERFIIETCNRRQNKYRICHPLKDGGHCKKGLIIIGKMYHRHNETGPAMIY